MASLYQKKGVSMIFYPGAFNLTTGPAHWELLVRARAVDNQVYVAAVSPARNMEADYKAWGYTSISNPYAEIIAKAEFDEEVIYAEIGKNLFKEFNYNLNDLLPLLYNFKILINLKKQEQIYHIYHKKEKICMKSERFNKSSSFPLIFDKYKLNLLNT